MKYKVMAWRNIHLFREKKYNKSVLGQNATKKLHWIALLQSQNEPGMEHISAK